MDDSALTFGRLWVEHRQAGAVKQATFRKLNARSSAANRGCIWLFSSADGKLMRRDATWRADSAGSGIHHADDLEAALGVGKSLIEGYRDARAARRPAEDPDSSFLR